MTNLRRRKFDVLLETDGDLPNGRWDHYLFAYEENGNPIATLL